MAERRRAALVAAAVAVALVPAAVAVTDRHLSAAPAALVISTAAAALAVPALTLQPLLAGGNRIALHRVIGSSAFVLVLAHVGALFVVGADDALFALSPDGPTRARMALLATVALLVVVCLGAGRARLPLADDSWRILHAFFAVLAIGLGLGHAILTDGAMDGAGTALLYAFGAVGLAAIPFAYLRRTGRARSTAVQSGGVVPSRSGNRGRPSSGNDSRGEA